MQVDIRLMWSRRFWESERVLWALFVVVVAVVAVVAFQVGYRIAAMPPAPIVIHAHVYWSAPPSTPPRWPGCRGYGVGVRVALVGQGARKPSLSSGQP